MSSDLRVNLDLLTADALRDPRSDVRAATLARLKERYVICEGEV